MKKSLRIVADSGWWLSLSVVVFLVHRSAFSRLLLLTYAFLVLAFDILIELIAVDRLSVTAVATAAAA